MRHRLQRLVGALPGIALATVLAAVTCVAAPASAAPAAFHAPRLVTRDLPNGLTAAVYQDARLPMVRVHVLVPAGLIAEPEHQAGVARLTSDLLLRGTASRSLAHFFYEVDALGAVLGRTATRDVATIGGEFLAEDFDAGLELLADCIRNPIFETRAVEGIKLALSAEVARSLGDPRTIVERELWSAVFPRHAYARSIYGTGPTRRGLTVEAIRFFHRTRYAPEQTIVAVAGDVDPERAFKAIEDRFGDWSVVASPLPSPSVPEAARQVRLVDTELPLARVAVGLRGPARGDRDETSMALLGALLAGGSGSRLDARVQDGELTRVVTATWTAQRDGGLLELEAAVPADSAAHMIEHMLDAIESIAADPPDEAELAPLVRRVRNAYPMRFETLSAVLGRWAEGRFNGLPVDFLEQEFAALQSIGPEDIRATAQRWLDPGRASIVAVGPAASLRGPIQRFGPIHHVGGQAAPVARREPTAAEKAKGRELIRNAIVAHGGKKRLSNIKDSTVEAVTTLITGDLEVEGRIREVRREPNRLIYDSVFEGVGATQTLSGDRAWSTSPLQGDEVQDMDETGVAALRNAFRSDVAHLLLEADGSGITLAHRGQESVGGRLADAVHVKGREIDRVLFIDTENLRLVAMDQHPSAPGVYSARRVYHDYRDVDGIWWPHLEERLLDGELKMRLLVVSVTFNTGVDQSLFERPERLEKPRPR